MFFNINWKEISSIITNAIVQIMLKYSTKIPSGIIIPSSSLISKKLSA